MTVTDRATTALLLAAGAGSRLSSLTKDTPKCLTEVGGVPILARLVNNLRENGIDRLVVVTGHLSGHIGEFLKDKAGDIQIDYIFSPEYRTTNNIYSLWLARDHIQEPFLLVESDLVFDACMLENMLQPDKIAISRMRPWMHGTTVTVAPGGTGKRVAAFHVGSGAENNAAGYKTVNIYSLSAPTWTKVWARLDRYISDGRTGEYYEAVFAELVADGSLSLEAVHFDPDRWYEIDTMADLGEAERIFGSAVRLPVGPVVPPYPSNGSSPLASITAND